MSWAGMSRATRTQQRRSETLTRVEPMTSSVKVCRFLVHVQQSHRKLVVGLVTCLLFSCIVYKRLQLTLVDHIRNANIFFFCIPTLLVTQRNLMQSNYISPKFHFAAKVEHVLFFFFQLNLFKFYYYFRVYFFLIKLIIFMLLFFLVFKIWKNKMVVFCYCCAV